MVKKDSHIIHKRFTHFFPVSLLLCFSLASNASNANSNDYNPSFFSPITFFLENKCAKKSCVFVVSHGCKRSNNILDSKILSTS